MTFIFEAVVDTDSTGEREEWRLAHYSTAQGSTED